MFKKIINNPSIFFLLGGNLYCIWYYVNHPEDFATVVWIYWVQSIIIGLFNFFDLLTIKKYDASNFKMNDQPLQPGNKGCTAYFFFLHFGFFHVAYAFFLLMDVGINNVSKKMFLLGLAVFLAESIFNFMRQKQLEKSVTFNIGTLFFLPYLRIIPMHLMILLPAFFGWKPSLLFLNLKMGADILSYIFYRSLLSKRKV